MIFTEDSYKTYTEHTTQLKTKTELKSVAQAGANWITSVT